MSSVFLFLFLMVGVVTNHASLLLRLVKTPTAKKKQIETQMTLIGLMSTD